MLINLWYVAEESHNVTDKPVKVKLLGQDFVLFRDGDGNVKCLSNVCIHRGGSFANGWCNKAGNSVVCPYHGWEFNGDGECTKVPSQEDERAIPKRARVDAYPTEERYGWIWVFLGDQSEEERIGIPDFPEYDDTETWRAVRTSFVWKAESARVVENGIDIAHAAFVHPTFGYQDTAESARIDKVTNETFGPYTATSENTTYPPALDGWRRFMRPDKAPTVTRPTFMLSGMTVRMHIEVTPKMHIIMFDANTPVDEHTTKTFAVQLRNFAKWSLFDAGSLKRLERILLEDAAIVEAASPNYLPEEMENEISVKSDKFMSLWRQARGKWIDDGNQIDSYTVNQHKGRKVFAIPSPARREFDKWALEPIPLMPSKDETQEAAE